VLPYLTGLSGRDFRFTIISFEKSDAYSLHAKTISAKCESAGLKWLPLKYHKRPAVVSTLYDIYELDRSLHRLYRTDPFSAVHCRSYITALVGSKFKRSHNVKFIFDMRGFWADERVEGGLWNLSNPLYNAIYRYFKKKEREFLRDADRIVSLTSSAKEEMKKNGVAAARIAVIPTCADMQHFNPKNVSVEQCDNLRLELGISKTSFVVLYLGSWGTWYMTEQMLDLFAVIKNMRIDATFLIVSPDKIDLTGYLFRNSVVVKSATRSEIPLLIAIANLSVFFIKPSYSKKASAATKMAELMAMNIPVISNKGWGDVEDYLDESSLITDFNSREYERVLSRTPLNVNTRSLALEKFSLDSGVSRYAEVYHSIL
jgi:glycosyltransferase involved in cell wall biosynthesis